MSRNTATAAEVFLRRLERLGVDYLFANGGTDFAPIIEAYARGPQGGGELPRPLVMPHETAAVGMAHGYTLVTGRPQAVMVHTNVGLANIVMGAINAACENIPMLLCSGRTPVTEQGFLGSRSLPINWGQEMRDQAALLRESVKWDYELRYPEQMAGLLDRAMAIALSAPRGPVYLSLPREALAARCAQDVDPVAAPSLAPADTAPPEAEVEAAAEILAAAHRPLIIAQRGGDTPAGFEGLRRFAEAFAIPVVEFWPSRNSLSCDSAMHSGYDPGAWLADADAVLVLDALVPWIPERHALPEGCRVVQAGPDPLFARFPVRGFRADVSLAGDVADILERLEAALGPKLADAQAGIAERQGAIAAKRRTRLEAAAERAEAGSGAPMTAAWVSHCLSEALDGDGLVFNELGCEPSHLRRSRSGSYFSHALSGGLGWGLPAALGAQLAERERLVVACLGDGSYTFANPVACHQIAEALELPVLTLVFNNGVWNAVRKATLDIYPEGDAARAEALAITSLAPAPDYGRIAEASRGYAEKVVDGAALPAALERALAVVREEKRQALLDVQVAV